MKNDIDSKVLLRAFDYIQSHGDALENGRQLNGLLAFSDHDGYTIYFKSNGATLSFGFHNTYHLDYENERQKNTLLEGIMHINKLCLGLENK
ncbi:hypothetical protein PALB_18000 [Pseudoalteromonas luteoviolacea B = ATCC 29581]|nr:hypothetical protein PALB_18000 [Pseudoalteromonas luteoviolacea B = ATCC 29581]